jgi:hypothetical protein
MAGLGIAIADTSIRRTTKMNRHPLRRTAWIVSGAVFAMICLQSGAGQARAATPDANPVVIRYLNDHGFVPSFEVADAHSGGHGGGTGSICRRCPAVLRLSA